MRPEGNALDLNNLPEEYGKQVVEESSTTTAASTDTTRPKKKKAGGKDESSKVYECRFCSLKFCKSQALGGHMNRHRQGKKYDHDPMHKRETETLNRARQLVFSNEGLAAAGAHMGLRDFSIGGSQPISPGGFQLHRGGSIADPCLQFRPVYPRLPTQAPHAPPPLQPYTYPSTSSHSNAYPPSYQPPHAPPAGEYFIGHVLAEAGTQRQPLHANSSSFTCFGAPLPAGAMQMDGVRAPVASRDAAGPGNQTADARNWGCSYGHE